jgi:hypothetical protein
VHTAKGFFKALNAATHAFSAPNGPEDRLSNRARKTPSIYLAISRGNGMPGRIFSDDERECAQHYRREARRRLVEEASATVDHLCAEAARPLPAWALAHAAKARTGKMRSLVIRAGGP